MRTTTRILTCIPLALGLALAVACSEENSSDDDDDNSSSGTGGISLGTGGGGAGDETNGGASTDTGGSTVVCDNDDFAELADCGWTTNAAKIKTPNLMFVIDKSGSMDDPIDLSDDESPDKWSGLIDALEAALETVDTDMGFGLIMYPHDVENSIPLECSEISVCCAVPEGESAIAVEMTKGNDGARAVTGALAGVGPGGGTPTAEALKRARDYFVDGDGAKLAGEKYVVLATDGGPNCNTAISCNAETCTTNISGDCSSGNCCANAPESCVDDTAVRTQIQALAAAGIKTFVVGIPGTEAYADFLDQFAIDGEAPNPDGPPDYYAVESSAGVEGLTQVFRDISTQLVTSCDIPLVENPEDPDQVNVAIDCNLIPETTDEEPNWEITYDTTPGVLHLLGDTCDRVQNDGAQQVDVVMGCPGIK